LNSLQRNLNSLHWTRLNHAAIFNTSSNVLFATLLLGLQRLEAAGVLPPAHQSMLDAWRTDMLEGWTLGDQDRWRYLE